jgi:hypothetical protein
MKADAQEDHEERQGRRETASANQENHADVMRSHLTMLLNTCAAKPEVLHDIPALQYKENNERDPLAPGSAGLAELSSAALLLYHLAPLVDMAYVICMHCDSLKFSASVKNIRLVNGAASDECSSIQDYHGRVGFSHKIAMTDAQLKGYSSILIAEEDATLYQLPDLTQFKAQVQKQWEENPQQLIRLTALPWEAVDDAGSCMSEQCKCMHKHDKTLCSLKQGCEMVHDSSLYMISEPAYSAFIGGQGQIDVHLFAHFDSVLVTPPVAFQHCWTWKPKVKGVSQCDGDETLQKSKWDEYEKACIVSEPSMRHHGRLLRRKRRALKQHALNLR